MKLKKNDRVNGRKIYTGLALNLLIYCLLV